MAKKAKKKAAPAKKTAKKKMASKKAKVAKRPQAKKAMSNRRKHRRMAARNLWVTERSGEYQYVVAAADISEGGIFLKGRLKTSRETSQLTIPLDGEQSLQLMAKPVHDRVSSGQIGTGYQFQELSSNQAKALRGLLRNLD